MNGIMSERNMGNRNMKKKEQDNEKEIEKAKETRRVTDKEDNRQNQRCRHKHHLPLKAVRESEMRRC